MILACLKIQGRKKHEVFYDMDKLWKRVLELGFSEAKRGKVLNIYSHNAQYDTAAYVDLTDKHMAYFCNTPFIWTYRLTKEEANESNIRIEGKYKEIIKFLDTMNIYTKMSLKAVGEIIGTPKTEYNLKDIETKTFTKEELKELELYCANDCEVTLKAIEFIQRKIKSEGLTIKRLYTINQIARQYLFNKWLKLDDEYLEPYFWNKKTGEARKTWRKEEIHAAYRGGRCEAWQTGKIRRVNYYDVNSLYPFALKSMKTPNLRSERKVEFKNENKDFNLDMFFSNLIYKIGVSRVLMKNESCEIGLLQIRTEKDNYYPIIGQTFIGTYTHDEILLALKEDYKLLDIEWSVTWEEAPNPFGAIVDETYKLRHESKNEFDNWWYKQMLNCFIGKLAQHKNEQIIEVDSIEEAQNYLKKNYQIIQDHEYQNFYAKENKEAPDKPYYMPIIPCLVTAWSRIHMYKLYKAVGRKDLVYSDTDSVVTTKDMDYLFKPSKELGQLKKVYENNEINIKGRKTYMINDEIKVSGITKRDVTKEIFENGEIESKKQITINTAKSLKDVGKFEIEHRNLNKQLSDYKLRKKMLNEQEILIDYDIKDINFFINTLSVLQ